VLRANSGDVRLSFDYQGIEKAGSILAKAYERKEIEKSPAEMQRAYELGVTL